jgi:tetratricopeptide (TPR) repeat protein
MRRRLLLLAAPLLLAQAPANRPTVDALLNALRAAPSEEAAGALEAQLRAQWRDQASPAIRLLISRGYREIGENAVGDAVDSFDAALDLDNDVVEAWRGRAQARLRSGDPTGAVRDIQEVLRREPRHFVAWQDLSRIAEARGDWRGALAAWQKLLEVDPKSPGAQTRLRELRRRALGEDT